MLYDVGCVMRLALRVGSLIAATMVCIRILHACSLEIHVLLKTNDVNAFLNHYKNVTDSTLNRRLALSPRRFSKV